MDRYQEIERRLRAGRSLREIARALGCSRRTVREIRDGLRGAPGRCGPSPVWTSQVGVSRFLCDSGRMIY
jgi:transposase-like protein